MIRSMTGHFAGTMSQAGICELNYSPGWRNDGGIEIDQV